MVTNTGKNLSILIMTNPGMDWQAFATWYSFKTNLPDSKIAVGCIKDGTTPFMFYQWCKRLLVHTFKFFPLTESSKEINWLDSVRKTKNWNNSDLLLVKPLVVATDLIDDKSINVFNSNKCYFEENVWFLKTPNTEKMIDDYFLEGKQLEKQEPCLCHEANEHHDPKWLVSYKKGCGKWINTANGCPFSNAAGFVTADMTANEHRVINLWKKMVPLFTVVS